MLKFAQMRSEIRPMAGRAGPLVLAEIGWMSMAIVDTMMVGRLPNSAIAIGAVSLGSVIYHTLVFFGGGLLIGLDTLVSQAFGAGKVEDCHHSLLNGIYLSFAITPVLMAANWWLVPSLRRVGVDPNVLQPAILYTRALGWGTLPLLLSFAV